MKKALLLFTIFFITQNLSAQNRQADITFSKCTSFKISMAVRDLPDAPENTINEESKDAHHKRSSLTKVNSNALPFGEDPVLQKTNGTKAMTGPIANWAGQSGTGYPPDPSGAAGPNHYVQAVNTSYRVYDKSGTPLISSKNLSSLWAGSTNEGDPIVLYDKFADRWFISQFQNDNSVLIAISTSPDPTGTFFTYSFLPASNDFPDYLKFSIWPDGYYMATNFDTQRMVVFERAKMIVGDASAKMIVKTMPSVPNDGFFCPLATDADGQLPPYGTPCYMFTFEDDGWASGNTDQIRIYKMSTDWATPANTTVVLDQTLPTQAFDAVFSSDWNNISQKGTTSKLDAIGGIFGYRAQYRIWTGYNTVTLCNPVKVNVTTGQAGIRWYELRQDNSTKVWSIYQQGTYAPDAESRWLGSIAMDNNGSIGMAFAISGTNTFPGLSYTGRQASDPLGQMTFAEQIAVTGTSAQTSSNRYGDYSHTSLDPDGLTFWHTGEYQSTGKKTRIFSFQIPKGVGINEAKDQIEFNVYQSDDQLNLKVDRLPSSDEMQIDLFDIMGKQIINKTVHPTAKLIETSINIGSVAPGTYLLRIGNGIFQKVIKIIVD